MELQAFIAELASELDRVIPDFAAWCATACAPEATPEAAGEVAAAYAAQAERLAETCEMIGLMGAALWCRQLQPLAAGLAAPDAEARTATAAYLEAWPPLLHAYFAAPADFDASAALAAYFADPAGPFPIDEAASLELAVALTTPPELPEDLAAEAAFEPIELQPEDASIALPADADPEVFAAMMAEAPDGARQFVELMARFAASTASEEDLRTAKRIAHSFKGSANIIGIRGLAKLGHYCEDLIEIIERDPQATPQPMRDTLVAAAQCIDQVVAHLSGEDEAPAHVFDTLSRVVECVNHAGAGAPLEAFVSALAPAPLAPAPLAAVAGPAAPPAPAIPASDADTVLRVPVRTLDELFRMSAELSVRVVQLQERLHHTTSQVKALTTRHHSLRQSVRDLERLVDLRGISMMRTGADEEQVFDPLEMDQYNELHGATRALSEVTVDATDLGREVADELLQLTNELMQQERLRQDMQKVVLGARMTPLASLVPRLTRNVRQTAQQTGKQAELVVTGEEILVDGDVLGALADPLLHILRNAIDHGLELPEDRALAGKPAAGRIEVRFGKVGTFVVVTVLDDGRGLDYDAIRIKAVERGLLPAAAAPSRAELARLIFMPGFSTRPSVSEISGRGIGMDIVLTRLKSIKGEVDITSEPGEGCTIQLRFQPSLATQHALLFRSLGQRFALPSIAIEQAFAAGTAEIGGSDDSPEVQYRGEALPLLDLAILLGAEVETQSLEAFRSRPILVVRVDLGRIAVAVDDILTVRELVVKGLGRLLAGMRGVSGAAILGDGTVVPVLDIEVLAQDPASSAWAEAAREAAPQTTKVLIVDDSLSVRKALSQLVQDAGYETRVAHDGLEAIRILADFPAAVVLTDLEMPNMNGLELTEHLRADPATQALPVVMVTSRSMDKHREQARRAGVSHYLIKPYNDLELLSVIHHAALGEPERTPQAA